MHNVTATLTTERIAMNVKTGQAVVTPKGALVVDEIRIHGVVELFGTIAGAAPTKTGKRRRHEVPTSDTLVDILTPPDVAAAFVRRLAAGHVRFDVVQTPNSVQFAAIDADSRTMLSLSIVAPGGEPLPAPTIVRGEPLDPAAPDAPTPPPLDQTQHDDPAGHITATGTGTLNLADAAIG